MAPTGRDFFKQGWELTRSNASATATYVALNLATALMPFDPVTGSTGSTIVDIVAGTALFFLPLWLMTGIAAIGIAAARGLPIPSIFSIDGAVVLKLLAAILIEMVLIALGIVLLVVPGLYLMVVWWLTPQAMVDGAGIYETLFRKTFRLASGSFGLIVATLSWLSLPMLPLLAIVAAFALTTGDFTTNPPALVPEPIATMLSILASVATVAMMLGSSALYVHLNDRRTEAAAATDLARPA